MAKNEKIVKIETGEEKARELMAQEQSMRQLYLKDGTIDATEQEALDRIAGKITVIEERITTLRKEVEAARQEWEGHATGYARVQEQQLELAGFGHADATVVQQSIEPIAESVTDMRWEDATAGLENVETNLEPIWADYEAKKAAKEEYDLLRPEFDFRLADAEAAGPYTEALTAQIGTVRESAGGIDSLAASGDWVAALDKLQQAVTSLEPIEAEIERIEAAKAAYEAELAALQPRLTDASTSEYTTLAEQGQAIANKQTEMEAAASTHDYETASARLVELAQMVDDFLARRAELDEKRAAYETALATIQNRLDAAKSCELASASDLQQTMLDTEAEMLRLAGEEDFEGAAGKVPELETALAEYEAMLADRDLYEARLAAIQDELTTYGVSTPEWGYLQTIQSQMATIQTAMEAAAASEDYETALAKITELEAKIAECLAEIEKKKQEYDTARANLDRQVSAAQSDANDAKPTLDTEMAAITAKVAPIDAAAAKEDWVGAKTLIQPAIDAVVAFNKAMLKAEAPNMTNGMSDSAIELAARSPELVENFEQLEAAGWQVVVGPAGGGSRCDKAGKILTIDANRFTNDLSAVQVLAHETGHAQYVATIDTSSRRAYIDSQLADEGAATMENIRVQREIIANAGADIGISGNSANHADYNAAYDQYLQDGDASKCRDAMGSKFGNGETVSGSSPPQTYDDYYGKSYDDWIAAGGTPASGSAPNDGDSHEGHTH